MLGRVDRGVRWRRPSVRHAHALASQHWFSHRRDELGIRRLSTDAGADADSFRALAATFAAIEVLGRQHAHYHDGFDRTDGCVELMLVIRRASRARAMPVSRCWRHPIDNCWRFQLRGH